MAELRVEKKKPVWPWVLVVLLIVGVVVWLLVRQGEVQVTDDGQINIDKTEQHDAYNDDVTTSR